MGLPRLVPAAHVSNSSRAATVGNIKWASAIWTDTVVGPEEHGLGACTRLVIETSGVQIPALASSRPLCVTKRW